MKRILFSLVLIASFVQLYSQPWLRYLAVAKGKQPNFFQSQQAFYKWEKASNIQALLNEEKEDESQIENWLQFKRWEYIWEARADVHGHFLDPWQIYQDAKAFREQYKIDYNSGDWKIIGPRRLPGQRTSQPNGLGRINAVVFDPTDSMTFYVCTASGGFWRTRDYGHTWEYLSVSLPTLGTSDALVDPLNPNTIYLATGDRDAYDAKGLGIWKTTDGGKTWQRVLDSTMTVNMLLMDPTDHHKIIAGATFGVYVSTDAGQTWQQTLANVRIKDLEFMPGNSQVVYATGQGLLFKSTDGGKTWSNITSRLNLPIKATRNVIAVSPAAPNWLYVLVTDDNGDYSSPFVGLYLSKDAGQSFSLQASSPNILGYESDGSDKGSQAWYDLCMAVDPTDANVVYTGGVNIWKSVNAGAGLTINAQWVGDGAPAIHADQHDLRFAPDGKTLFACNDGGIYYTKSGGEQWKDITSGLSISQVYRIGPSADKPLLFLNGYQDNGTALAMGIDSFATVIGGDGMQCLIDYSSDDYKFGETYNGDIRRSVKGSSFRSILGNIDEKGYWVTPYVQNPHEPKQLLAGYVNLWLCNDIHANTIKWQKITDLNDNSQIIAVEYCIANPSIVYFAKRDGSLYRMNISGSSVPIDLTANLPGKLYITSIETDETDQNIVYITAYDRVNRRGLVLKSLDQGQTWINITGNLPREYFNCIVQDTSSQKNQLYLGTYTGVYTRNDSMSDWVDFSSGMPVTDVRELEIYYGGDNPSQRHIKAATYGRGAWYSPLFVENNVDVACHIPRSIDFCLDQKMPVYIVNLGLDTLRSAKLYISVDGVVRDSVDWHGAMVSYQSDTLYFSGLLKQAGKHDIQARIIDTDQGKKDENLTNNVSSVHVNIVLTRPSYKQSFAEGQIPKCWQLGQGWNVTTKNNIDFLSQTSYNGFLMLKNQGSKDFSSSVVTCAFDFSGYREIFLKLEQLLKMDNGIATIDYSLDKKAWNNLATFTGNRGSDRVADIFVRNISDLANQPLVFFRFNYQGRSDVIWALDDFEITDRLGQNVITDPVLVYPNPATDMINISFRQEYDNVTLRLMSLEGSVLYYKSIANPQFEQISLSSLRPGIYLLEIVTPGQTISKKVLVQ